LTAFALVGGAFLVIGADGVGFEPTETRNASPVFKTGGISGLTCEDVPHTSAVVIRLSRT
jgi:hypothetical protein